MSNDCASAQWSSLPRRCPSSAIQAWPHLPCTAALTLLLLVLISGSGCKMVKTAAEVPAQTVRAVTPGLKEKKNVDPVEVQQAVMRSSDDFATRISIGLERLRRQTNAPSGTELLEWKIALVTETSAIASGPNAIANLLDLILFVTITQEGLEKQWPAKDFGASAETILEGCRTVETQLWNYANQVLEPTQQKELRAAIEMWRQKNPLPEDILAARALGFSPRLSQSSENGKSAPGSVFSLLRLDPLAGLDPATREIAQSRLFAERALFVAQRMPPVLRWQTELLSLNALQTPAVGQLITNSTQLAGSVERVTHLAEQLPAQIATERQEILKALQSQESELTRLAAEIRQTLIAGSGMSTSLNTTLTTFDHLMERFGVGETNKPANTNGEPFRILDYGQTAAQLERTALQLTELLRTFDHTLGSSNLTQLSTKVGPVVQEAQSSGKSVVDYAFRKAMLLVLVLLIAALVYRFIAVRLIRPS